MNQRNLPSWVAFWLLLSAIVCTIDALFIILRPHTLPGGKWNYLIRPYNIYIEVDKRYVDLNDSFVKGVSWMNLVEVALNCITLAIVSSLLLMHTSGKAGLSNLFAFMVSTMTFAKTVLYFLLTTSVCGGQHYVSHNDWKTTILLYYFPNGIWIIIPFLCMVATGRKMLAFMDNEMEAKKMKSR